MTLPNRSAASAATTGHRAAVAVAVLTGLLAGSVSAAAGSARGSAWTSAAPGSAWTAGVLDPGLSSVGDALQDVIVSAEGGVRAAAEAVRGLGGQVETSLPLVDGVEARVPAHLLPQLAGTTGVTTVTADRQASFEQLTYDSSTVASNVARSTQATSAWSTGNLGAGVGIAVLDTGISQMKDLEGRLVHGPDLSGEGSLVDTYGHGTVMAGAAGGSGADSAALSRGLYPGVAPKSTLVAVKVAGRNGVADVSTILQGMHWVSSYKDQFNIRVLNLSWGTPSTQDPAVDPLNYAVQRLWQQGVVVVVAAGNSGPAAGTIMKPADDPLVVSVGAYDDKQNDSTSDDAVPAWSSQGPTAQGLTKPDLVVPGRTLVTARSYGSRVESENPKALISPSYIRGSGTSQAAAVTSGLAALLIAARPSLTPDQVKHLLKSTAQPIAGVSGGPTTVQGSGRVQLGRALTADPGPAVTQTPTATGLGSIEASRGGRNVETVCPGQSASTLIKGEIDVRCEGWNGSSWTGSSWTGSSWTGSSWTGSSWTGSSWTGSSWTGSTDDDEQFLTAWWGNLPPAGKVVPGEKNDVTVQSAKRVCRLGDGAVCA